MEAFGKYLYSNPCLAFFVFVVRLFVFITPTNSVFAYLKKHARQKYILTHKLISPHLCVQVMLRKKNDSQYPSLILLHFSVPCSFAHILFLYFANCRISVLHTVLVPAV